MAVLEPEAGHPRRPVAVVGVQRRAEHGGDQQARSGLGHQARLVALARRQMQVVGRDARRPGQSARGVAGRGQAQLGGGGGVQQPGGDDAVLDDVASFDRHALVIEGGRAQAAQAEGIVDHVHARGQDPLTEFVLQEGAAARDGRAGNGAQQGRQDLGGDAVLEDDRGGGRGDLARADAGHGAFARLQADLGGARQVGQVAGRPAFTAALHGPVLLGDDADAQREGAALMATVEAVRGDQTPFAGGPGGVAAFGLGHACDVERGGLGLGGGGFQRLGGALGRIEQVQIGVRSLRQPVLRGQGGVGVFRRQLRHRHGALDQTGAGRVRQVRGRHRRLTPADEDAQP